MAARARLGIQGVVHLTDNGSSDGGFSYIEGSRDIFPQYLDKHPASGYFWSLLDITDPLFNGKRIIKACVPAGHILLFDSRVAHSVSPARHGGGHWMVTYVTMMPRQGADAKEIAKRNKLYSENRMTGHWCYGPYFKETDKVPHVPGGKPPSVTPPPYQVPPLESVSETRRNLIGR